MSDSLNFWTSKLYWFTYIFFSKKTDNLSKITSRLFFCFIKIISRTKFLPPTNISLLYVKKNGDFALKAFFFELFFVRQNFASGKILSLFAIRHLFFLITNFRHDVKLLERCIDEGLSVDAIVTSTSLTLLHHAVVSNNVEIAEFLLERYAS